MITQLTIFADGIACVKPMAVFFYFYFFLGKLVKKLHGIWLMSSCRLSRRYEEIFLWWIEQALLGRCHT